MLPVTGFINHALEAAVRRAYALGRVDQSIERAAEQLREMVRPGITPAYVRQVCGLPATEWADWDQVLWEVADIWCDLYRGLHARPKHQPPASPYSVLRYAVPVPAGSAALRPP
jgi:hypothetical protein